MNDTEHKNRILNEIALWEKELQADHRTDLEQMLNRWMSRKIDALPDSVKQLFFNKIDASLFNLHSFMQNSLFQQDAKKKILLAAKTLNKQIVQIDDLHMLSIDQLYYLADLQIAKHRLYSFIQGGLTGSGGILLAGVDIPTQTLLNLRSIQMVAMCYGYEINNPFEMMLSLKVYHASLMPRHLQYQQWQELKKEIEDRDNLYYFYEGKEDLADLTSLEFILKQVAKLSVLSFLKRKAASGLPLFSIVIGAGANYQLTRQVTEFANKFYQYRLINEKSNGI